MGKLYSFSKLLTIGFVMTSLSAYAQSNQYQRKKSTSAELPPATAPAAPGKPGNAKDAAPAAEANKAKKDEKVDLTDLENQYWAPKDKEFSVVQNRKYTKEKKFGVSLQGGTLVNDAYATGYGNLNLTVAYYLTEKSGVEFMYTSYNNDESKIVKRFKSEYGGGGSGALPNYNQQQSYIGVAYNWIPFYGKMSLLDDTIIYFDMAFSPGIGYVSYDHTYQNDTTPSGAESGGSAVAISLDISQHFFIHENWAVRVDFKNRFYSEKVKDASGSDAGKDLGSSSKTDSMLLIGVTYYH